MKMSSKQLREKFIDFFEKRGHKAIPSASILPEREKDLSVLFTTAGMHPLVPYLLGEAHPAGKCLVSIQKCIRTDDIDKVGDNIHLTFFEMMGNWSLGDCSKKEAIAWSYEFLTCALGIKKENLAISVFAGDNDAPFDKESYDAWRSLGISDLRIKKLSKKDNWWGPVGDNGPCGPDTEMFLWQGEDEAPAKFDPTDANWVEIWNDVFMEYNRIEKIEPMHKEIYRKMPKRETVFSLNFKRNEFRYKYEPLKQKNVDTGLGLERMVAYLEDKKDLYQTELFWPIIQKIEEISGKKYEENKKEMRIIADHIKAAIFIIADGVLPSNKERGYVARRLIRRAIVKAKVLGVKNNFISEITEEIFKIYNNIYRLNRKNILIELKKEEEKFSRTVVNGLRFIYSPSVHKLTGRELFNLYQSFGLPLEITIEEAKIKGLEIDNKAIEQYNNFFKQHQEKSRTASAGMFRGGLADAEKETIKLHTVAHLMLAALRKIYGSDVNQKGSNINAERLRFDFNHYTKMTPEEIKKVEEIVNQNIKDNLPVTMEELSLEEAKKSGATGIFLDRYGDKVKVYTIGDLKDPVSREICGGPHVKNTSELGKFKITKEESSGAGIRRIKAVLL